MHRPFLLLGLSHRSAPVEAREQLAVADADLGRTLEAIERLPSVEECVLMSTCNRVEVMLCGESVGQMRRELMEWFERERGLSAAWLEKYTYVHEGEEALRHLFRVTASLDSLIVGEPQITGQVRDAYRRCREHGICGSTLGRVFDHALRTAKRIRTETRIAENAVSVSFAAVELAKKVFGKLEGKRLLVIGAGKMGVLAVRHLNAAGATSVDIVNRSLARARATADELGGRAHSMEELGALLEEVDIVISSTGAQDPVLLASELSRIVDRRRFRPLFLIDIAVPRDVEAECGELPNVYLFDVDDLGNVVENNLAGRQREAERAERIVEDECQVMLRRLAEQEVVPTIVALRERLHGLRSMEMERFARSRPELDEEVLDAVHAMTRRLVNKVLHAPMLALRESAREEEGPEVVDAVHRLFHVEPGGRDGEHGVDDEEEDEWVDIKEKLH